MPEQICKYSRIDIDSNNLDEEKQFSIKSALEKDSASMYPSNVREVERPNRERESKAPIKQ